MLVTSYDVRIRSRSQTEAILDPPFPDPMAAHCPSGLFSIAFTRLLLSGTSSAVPTAGITSLAFCSCGGCRRE